MIQAAALSIVSVTVGLSIGRPKIGRLQIDHAAAGVLGAVLTLLLGIAPPETLLTAAKLLAAPATTLVSLMLMTQVAERAGLFENVADAVARLARGDGRRLFTYIFIAGAVVGTVFTNDAAVLIFTPLVVGLIERIGGGWKAENRLPFYFVVLYVANLVGALVVANPINLVMANLLGIRFAEFGWWMTLPALASMAASYAAVWFYFRKDIPRQFTLVEGRRREARPRGLQPACVAVLAATLVGLFTESTTGLPAWAVAAAGALAMLLIHATLGRSSVTSAVRGVGWDAVVFMVGMFVVGLGLRNVGVTHAFAHILQEWTGGGAAAMRAAVGAVAGFSSALVNNHPTADLMAFTIQDLPVSLAEKKSLAFAALIGGDLGPKMLPIGSLAALIWFRLLRNRGIDVSYWTYIRIGIPATLAAIAASLLVLEMQCRLPGVWTPGG